MEMVYMMKGDIHKWTTSDRKMSKLKEREVIFISFVSISIKKKMCKLKALEF